MVWGLKRARRSVHNVDGAGRKEHEARGIASVERQLTHSALANRVAHLGVGRVDNLRIRGDLNRLLLAADPHGDIERSQLTDGEDDSFLQELLETAALDGKDVAAGRDCREAVKTGIVGDGGEPEIGLRVHQNCLTTGYDGARRVCDGARQDRIAALSVADQGSARDEHQEKHELSL